MIDPLGAEGRVQLKPGGDGGVEDDTGSSGDNGDDDGDDGDDDDVNSYGSQVTEKCEMFMV